MNVTAKDADGTWRCAHPGEATPCRVVGEAGTILDLLSRAATLRLRARWRKADGSIGTGEGNGTVRVHRDAAGAAILTEEGRWSPVPGASVAFRGGYRWKAGNDVLSVEHVRQGISRAVFLVELVPVSPGAWTSRMPHRCHRDRYDAELTFRGPAIVVRWHARGPTKDYTLSIEYALAGPPGPGHHVPHESATA